QNERERGHEDWAQARPGGVHRGFAGGGTFFFFLPRELDDQNGVLGSQADENDEADLRQDIDGHAERQYAYRSEPPLQYCHPGARPASLRPRECALTPAVSSRATRPM